MQLCVYCGEPLEDYDIEVGSDTHELCLYRIRSAEEYRNTPDVMCRCGELGKYGDSCLRCDAMLS